jgi:hypothetical protein
MQNPVLKINTAKKDEGVAQVVECLPSKHKTLSSTPSTAKKTRKEIQSNPGREAKAGYHGTIRTNLQGVSKPRANMIMSDQVPGCSSKPKRRSRTGNSGSSAITFPRVGGTTAEAGVHK